MTVLRFFVFVSLALTGFSSPSSALLAFAGDFRFFEADLTSSSGEIEEREELRERESAGVAAVGAVALTARELDRRTAAAIKRNLYGARAKSSERWSSALLDPTTKDWTLDASIVASVLSLSLYAHFHCSKERLSRFFAHRCPAALALSRIRPVHFLLINFDLALFSPIPTLSHLQVSQCRARAEKDVVSPSQFSF